MSRLPLWRGLARTALLALAAAGAWGAARPLTAAIETRSAAAAQAALAQGGFGWASARADGLLVHLAGDAPDESAHTGALSAAAGAIGARRIRDGITPASSRPVDALPRYRLEILRSARGGSVVGLVPATLDRAALIARLGPGPAPTDLLETGERDAPPGWDAALDLALDAAALLPRARISVTPGRVELDAVADGAADKTRIEAALAEARPQGVALIARIEAPRPVISPFALRAVRAEGTTTLPLCAAEDEDGRARILAAARNAGAAAADCAIGLGAPSEGWAAAATAGLAALAALPAGTLDLSGTAVTLSAPAEVPEAEWTAARDRLAAALPPGFALRAQRTDPQHAALPAGPPRIEARTSGGAVQLRGAVADARMKAALDSLARARFAVVATDLTETAGLPEGWTARVLAGLEALAQLRDGTLDLTPELVRLSGRTGDRAAAPALAAGLSRRLGPGAAYELALTHDPRLDPASGLPDAETCVARMTEAAADLSFGSGSAELPADAAPVVARLAEAMRGCGDFPIELGVHTDASGSAEGNLALSRARAASVLAALREAGADVQRLTAQGYGESQPLRADEDDEADAANRRIAFQALSLEPAPDRTLVTRVTRGTTTVTAITPTPPAPDAAPSPANTADAAATGAPGPANEAAGGEAAAPRGPASGAASRPADTAANRAAGSASGQGASEAVPEDPSGPKENR